MLMNRVLLIALTFCDKAGRQEAPALHYGAPACRRGHTHHAGQVGGGESLGPCCHRPSCSPNFHTRVIKNWHPHARPAGNCHNRPSSPMCNFKLHIGEANGGCQQREKRHGAARLRRSHRQRHWAADAQQRHRQSTARISAAGAQGVCRRPVPEDWWRLSRGTFSGRHRDVLETMQRMVVAFRPVAALAQHEECAPRTMVFWRL